MKNKWRSQPYSTDIPPFVGEEEPELPGVISTDFRKSFPNLVYEDRIPIRKPGQEFFRVRQGADMSMVSRLLHLHHPEEWYQVHPDMADSLESDLVKVRLHVCMNRAQDLFLWPIKLNRRGIGKSWSDSALELAEKAKLNWIRITAATEINRYRLIAQKQGRRPKWPDMSFQQALDIAFADFRVDSYDHPVAKMLMGDRSR